MRSWTPKLIQQVNTVSNQISRTIYFWLDSLFGGYDIEFATKCTQSYSATDKKLFKGLRGRYLKALSTWFKIFLCDKGVMRLEYDHPST